MTLANWQDPPHHRWAFRNVREVVPTAPVRRGDAPVSVLPLDLQPLDELAFSWRGDRITVGETLARTDTSGALVLHRGRIVLERYDDGMRPDATHLLMSVTKSFIGCIAGILRAAGTLDVDAEVQHYLPELAGSGYAGATVQHLLDMRSGIRFSEDYADLTSEARILEQVIGWRPRTLPDLPPTMYDFLRGLSRDMPHGGPFSYRSCETDVLGWVCERVTGTSMPDLLSDLLWSQLGAEHDAEITVDGAGAALHDGGLCTTLRDLGRFGQLLLCGGRARDGGVVVPEEWLDDCRAGGPDSRAAFAPGPAGERMPGGHYRNQFWVPHSDRDVLLCLGIHGQLVYVDPAASLVVVKLSTWPTPLDDGHLLRTLAACAAMGGALG